MARDEAIRMFQALGSECGAWVIGDSAAGSAEQGTEMVERCLLRWHRRFTRFDPRSELSMLNDDPRETIEVSSMMARFIAAVLEAAELTGGLVDATLLGEIERAGYRTDLDASLPLAEALRLAPARAAAAPHPDARWRGVRLAGRTLHRPVGVKFDSGGIAKGMFADLLGDALAAAHSYAVDCGGDVRVGGQGLLRRRVEVLAPTGGRVVHAFELCDGAVATSGIAKRSWLDAAGAPAHHLLDPCSGRPAYTGVVQATALAPTATEAEARSKAALLSGPAGARAWLPHGGVLVFDDATEALVEPDPNPSGSGSLPLPLPRGPLR
ncbi:MAG: FAD:protein FMN transferase [Solirubrobacteraceae bacterium]